MTPGLNRAAFLKSAAGTISATALGLWETTAAAAERPHGRVWKGRPGSRVRRWAVVTIGNLSRNRYWGESDAKAMRAAVCTCTLVEGPDFRLLVDPSLAMADEMARELERRAGLKPKDITDVFVTHEHADHYAGLAHFQSARWFAAADVAAKLNSTKKWRKAISPAPERLFEMVDVFPTPGHTLGSHSIRFDCNDTSVAVIGDAAATEDFWRERRGYFNCVDFALSAKSMDKIETLADVVVPGHDNYFLS